MTNRHTTNRHKAVHHYCMKHHHTSEKNAAMSQIVWVRQRWIALFIAWSDGISNSSRNPPCSLMSPAGVASGHSVAALRSCARLGEHHHIPLMLVIVNPPWLFECLPFHFRLYIQCAMIRITTSPTPSALPVDAFIFVSAWLCYK